MSPHLSLDIQVEIMKRLPVKSLIQFRSVCKDWKSLIDSSRFIAGYHDDQPRQHLMIRYGDGYWDQSKVKHVCFMDDDTFPQQKFSPTLPPLFQLFEYSRIIGSSRGLFCLDGLLIREPDDSPRYMVVLWNPSIRKSIAIVLPHVLPYPYDYVVALGVCPHTKDPRLVKITYMSDSSKMESMSCIPFQVMVFTLSSGEWTTLSSNHLPRKSIEFARSSTVIGRFIHWLAYDWSAFDGNFHMLIMSFDLSTHEFIEVHLPDSLGQSNSSISRLRESLIVLDYSISSTTDKQVCDVWMMEHGDQKAFTKLFTIKAPNVSVLLTMGFRNNGEPIIVMLDDDDDEDAISQSAIVVYETCLEHIKDLGIHGPSNSICGSSYTYTESLFLLNHDDSHIVECAIVKR